MSSRSPPPGTPKGGARGSSREKPQKLSSSSKSLNSSLERPLTPALSLPPAAHGAGEERAEPKPANPLVNSVEDEASAKAAAQAKAKAMSEVQNFRDDFTSIQEGFRLSLDREGWQLAQIKELKVELVEKTYQLQAAYAAKQEDEAELFELRSELSRMAQSRDTAVHREDAAKEIIARLQDEVNRLRVQVGELQSTVAHLTDSEPPPARRPPLMAGLEATILSFNEWKRAHPEAYGAAQEGAAGAHTHLPHALTSGLLGAQDRPLRGRRPLQTEEDPGALAGFFDVSVTDSVVDKSLPQPSALTFGLDGRRVPVTAMSRAEAGNNRKIFPKLSSSAPRL